MYATLSLAVLFVLFSYCSNVKVPLNNGEVKFGTVIIGGQEILTGLGVPYALPPKRFSKPVEITEKLNTTYIADKKKPLCMQYTDVAMSEDCLYLNIWAPAKKPKNVLLPVIIWLTAEGFENGTVQGIDYDYDGGKLSRYTNSVVVVVNFRLNIFGFLFGNTEEVPGNMALYDQRLAMKWVNQNIRYIGGDPNNVILFGEGSGSICVNFHLMAPDSYPFFSKAIMMSGIALEYASVDMNDWALKRAIALSRVVGCDVDINASSLPKSAIDCLREKDAKTLMKAAKDKSVDNAAPKPLSFPFIPIVGDFLSKPPRELWKQKQFKTNTSLLIGSVFIEIHINFIIKPNENPTDAVRRYFSKAHPEFLTQKQAEELIEFYFIGVNETKNRKEAILISSQLISDFNFQCPTNMVANAFYEVESSSVFQVMVNYKAKTGALDCDLVIPCHTADLPLTFGWSSHGKDKIASRYWQNIIKEFVNSGTAPWRKYYKTSDNVIVPVYYEFKGKQYDIRNTQTGFRFVPCKLWKSMIFP